MKRIIAPLLVFFCIAPLFVGCAINDNLLISSESKTTETTTIAPWQEVDNGKEIGNMIVKAIETYYFENGKYPINLEELVPKYLTEIPTTITNQKIIYHLNPQENIEDPFTLGFPLATNINTGCFYFHSLLRLSDDPWECGPLFVP